MIVAHLCRRILQSYGPAEDQAKPNPYCSGPRMTYERRRDRSCSTDLPGTISAACSHVEQQDTSEGGRCSARRHTVLTRQDSSAGWAATALTVASLEQLQDV